MSDRAPRQTADPADVCEHCGQSREIAEFYDDGCRPDIEWPADGYRPPSGVHVFVTVETIAQREVLAQEVAEREAAILAEQDAREAKAVAEGLPPMVVEHVKLPSTAEVARRLAIAFPDSTPGDRRPLEKSRVGRRILSHSHEGTNS